MSSATPLWAKDLPLDAALHRFTVGQDPVTDLAILPWDVLGSAAHARTLAKGGYLSTADVASIVDALKTLHPLTLAGEVVIQPEQEDGHTALEAELTKRCGEAGKRIHLGRSRNDQVILALRLLMRDRTSRIGLRLATVAQAFLDLAEKHRDVPLPGYTHLRRAMPSTWGMWGVAMAEGLLEELEALEGVLTRLDRCPSGAAAGFGAPVPLDRALTASLLGFSRVQRSPIDVISSRGRHEVALADALASVALVLEKACWDLSLWTMEEFGFVRLPDAFTTGSSIMPQKRNPDVLELSRGTCRAIRGQAGALRELAGGLPSSYHREAQLLKAPLVALLDTADGLLAVLPRLLDGLEIHADACARACSDDLFAAHAASRLAAEGLPFRDAYKAVAREVLSGTFVPAESDRTIATCDLDSPCQELMVLTSWYQQRLAHWQSRYEELWTAPLA